MVLMNLGSRKPNVPLVRDPHVSDVQGLQHRFMQNWILCGQKWIEMWIKMDSTLSFPSGNKWPSCIEQNDLIPQLDSLTNIGQLTFLHPGVWKGLHLNSDIVKPAGATDWIVAQGWPASANSSPKLLDLSQCKLDPERPWNRDEEHTLITLRKQKKTFAEIATRLRRKELQVVCKYIDIVPLRSSGFTADQRSPQLETREEISVYILWVGYDSSSVDGNQGGWRVYGYLEIHCETENGF
jgi:hypothetical protein